MSQFNPAVRPNDGVSFVVLPKTEKMRGLPLVATWAALIAAPWVVIYGVATLVF